MPTICNEVFVFCFVLFLFLFMFFSSVDSLFQCYECRPDTAGDQYTPDQCVKHQKKVNCTDICVKVHGKLNNGTQFELRRCAPKSHCEDTLKTVCTEDAFKKVHNITECSVACCVSVGDIPCNSGLSVSTSMMMMMTMRTIMMMMMFADLVS